MKKNIILFIILLIYSNNTKAYDTSSVKYCPLSVGNVYVYLFVGGGYGAYYKSRILKDSVINGKKYFYWYNEIGTNHKFRNGWYRTDTVSGSLYKFDSNSVNCYNHEKLIDSLAAIYGDTIRNCNTYTGMCFGTINVNIFGSSRLKKVFTNVFTSGYETDQFIKYIGYYYYFFSPSNPAGQTSYTLYGCYVNGIKYGDTTIADINPINKEIPGKYTLSQNYPNPFNPCTNIKFSVPSNGKNKTSNGKIIVYDILGKEVATLVNEKLHAGTYETTFDGSAFPSGVYIYRLQTEDYTETKKMLLIK